ncbi:hypothetical protein ACTA71_000311 [Dictyostelium dimigraforme]
MINCKKEIKIICIWTGPSYKEQHLPCPNKLIGNRDSCKDSLCRSCKSTSKAFKYTVQMVVLVIDVLINININKNIGGNNKNDFNLKHQQKTNNKQQTKQHQVNAQSVANGGKKKKLNLMIHLLNKLITANYKWNDTTETIQFKSPINELWFTISTAINGINNNTNSSNRANTNGIKLNSSPIVKSNIILEVEIIITL